MTHHAAIEPPTGATRRFQDATRTWLPIGTVATVVIFIAGIIWWTANQARDISDARRVAEEAKASAQAAAADGAAMQLKQAEILTKLSGIETQLAELRALMIRRSP